jgi:hypothetical protein
MITQSLPGVEMRPFLREKIWVTVKNNQGNIKLETARRKEICTE